MTADPDVDRLLTELEHRHYGKYRGLVTGHEDPLAQGRLQVQVPQVLGEHRLWALPCVPYAGPDVGLVAFPPLGAGVWVEFEGGDRNHPVWVGGFWNPGELPADAAVTTVLLRTPGATVRIDDDGTVEVETSGGTRLVLTGSEISLEAPAIKGTANGGAMELSASGFDAMSGAFKVV